MTFDTFDEGRPFGDDSRHDHHELDAAPEVIDLAFSDVRSAIRAAYGKEKLVAAETELIEQVHKKLVDVGKIDPQEAYGRGLKECRGEMLHKIAGSEALESMVRQAVLHGTTSIPKNTKSNGAGNGHAAGSSQKSAKPSNDSADREAEWPDPEWSLLDDRRGALPEFPIRLLDKLWQVLLERLAHGAGGTIAHVAVPLLGIVGSLIGVARRIAATRSFAVPCTLWAAIVGQSGTSKTPAIEVTLRVLARIQKDRKSEIAELQRRHEEKVAIAKTTAKKWEKDVAAAIENGTPMPPRPAEADAPEPFTTPRMFASDVTMERVAVLVQARPRGLVIVRDELSGLFLNMSRYSGGSDREFWLEAYNGSQYTVERIGRPPVCLDHLPVGLVGGLQPDKLARSFEGDHDGMSARLLYSWPSEPPYKPLSDDADEIEPELHTALTRITGLVAEEDGVFAPRMVRLSDDARRSFEDFRKAHARARKALDGLEGEWWAKGNGAVLRLAGTLAFLSWSLAGGEEPPTQIDDRHLQAAVVLWRDYFWPHARAALRQIGMTEKHANVRRVLRWMQANQKTEVSVMDIRRDALGQKLDAQETERLIDMISGEGFLRPIVTPTKGRSRRRWLVNPNLHAGSAESAGRGVEP